MKISVQLFLMLVCYVDPNHSITRNPNFEGEILMKFQNLIILPSFATFAADSVAISMLPCSLIVLLVNDNTESEVS